MSINKNSQKGGTEKKGRKITRVEVRKWVKKEGYETRLLADACDMGAPETEVQLVKFHKGKYSHRHKRKTEFFYFTAGQGWVTIKGQRWEIKPGTELLVNPDTHHEFVNENEEPLEAIMFKTNNQSNDTFTK